MNVLMIDAGPDSASNTFVALEEVSNQLTKEGVHSEIVYVGQDAFETCTFCNACKTTGRCAIQDKLNMILEKAEQADAYIFATQSHYGVANGALSALIHRFLMADLTKTGKPVAAVVTCRRSGATSAVSQLQAFFAMNSMPIVTSSYWNVLVGITPELARQDQEGLRAMRNLARNMAWLIQNIESGKQSGVKPLEIE